MSNLGIYAYVDGSDLENSFAEIELCMHQFLVGRNWHTEAKVISTHNARTPDLTPDELSQWNLGFNLVWPNDEADKQATKKDLFALGEFLFVLSQQTGREFVLGIYDENTSIDEDYAFITATDNPINDLITILNQYD